MKERLQKNFSVILSLIVLTLTVVIAFAIIEKPTTASNNYVSNNTTESNLSSSEGEHFGFITYEPNDSDWSSINKTPKTNDLPVLIIANNTLDFPVYREVVIVYFKEMPKSIDEFAAAYNVTPIFVKEDIKMAAFESNPRKVPGITSEKTESVIENISKDSLVEQVKRDTYMFTDKEREITTTPSVEYPEEYIQKGVEYVPNLVSVSFWRLPPTMSLEEFGAKYGGKLDNPTTSDLEFQSVWYETEDVKGFIDRASENPYVSNIQPAPYFHSSAIPNDE